MAINEREDNLNVKNLSDDKIELINKIKTRPDLVFQVNDFSLLHEMAAQTRKLWENGSILKLYFIDNKDERPQRVLEYASIWSEYCSIKFQTTQIIDEAQIRVAFQAPSSWSYIGTDALCVPKSEPTINFGWLNDKLPEEDYKQVVLHEFGHALGLIHEHQSPAININWNKPYVYTYFETHHSWTKAEVDKNVFQEFELTSTQYSELDKLSIMGYRIPSQFTNDGYEFPINYTLSDLDKQYIGQIYPQIIHS